MSTKTAWETYTDTDLSRIESLCEKYRRFLDAGKTERECVTETIAVAKKNGYISLADAIKNGQNLKAGDKLYTVCMNKTIILYHLGSEPLAKGLNILGAHIDSPRLDIKQNPLYEDGGMAFLDTHYYGGIKKYQWVAIPLAIHGTVAKTDGSVLNISIGSNPGDPVFFISDLPIHLAAEQLEKKGTKLIEGEVLDIIVGNKPLIMKSEEKKDAKARKLKNAENATEQTELIKKGILNLLKSKYNIEEADFVSAELEVVPAGNARDAGLDASMVLAYGQDDRVCSFCSLSALFEQKKLTRSACVILTDKEEIGSVGATGMHSRFFENSLAEIMSLCGQYSELALRRALTLSNMLSCDVGAGFDPSFASMFDKRNSAYPGRGLIIKKFTGVRGKSMANDANAEYLARLRKLFDDEKITYQTCEMGKVDAGGGGTIAYILAEYGMNVVDCGVPLLNMHAPYEAVSKADIYEAFKGYSAFLKKLTA